MNLMQIIKKFEEFKTWPAVLQEACAEHFVGGDSKGTEDLFTLNNSPIPPTPIPVSVLSLKPTPKRIRRVDREIMRMHGADSYYLRWTRDQDLLLVNEIREHGSTKENLEKIAKQIGRNASAVSQRYYRLTCKRS